MRGNVQAINPARTINVSPFSDESNVLKAIGLAW
jgi:hypothetical protein